MKVVIPGGSGQVGTALARAFIGGGHEVVVLSRTRIAAPWKVVEWDGETMGPWAREINGADVVINLAGRSVNCRYGPDNRRAIIDSRILSTRVVGQAIAAAASPPRVWLQASTATIYAHRFDAANDDDTGIIGGHEPGAPETWRFSIDVATSWERELDAASTPRTRKVAMRSAMTMGTGRGGIFDTLLTLTRLGLGGRAGDGRQYMSWVHEADFIRAVDFLIAHNDIAGPIIIASPNPLPQDEFMRVLRRAWGAPVGLPATRWMLAIGAFLMRTETELILKSRRVVPSRLLREGFVFDFPDWPAAALDLCAKMKG